MRQVISTIVILLISFLIAYLINYEFVENLIVGDECKYDTIGIKTTRLFNLFYEISSNTGYHPEPTKFNFYFTSGCSFFIGLVVSYRLFWMKRIKSNY
jgi:hypothetical protein